MNNKQTPQVGCEEFTSARFQEPAQLHNYSLDSFSEIKTK